jgi:hypothetical protein
MQPESIIRRVWQRMAEIYGHRWTSAYGDDAGQGAGVTWAKGLSGLSPEQIARGIEGAIVSADSWPPTLPEFRALCLGIPTLAAAKVAINDKENAFSRLMWMRMDPYAFRVASSERAENIIAGAYHMAREHVMRGGALPPAPEAALAYEPEMRVPATPETAQAAFERIQKLLGEKPDAEEAA